MAQDPKKNPNSDPAGQWPSDMESGSGQNSLQNKTQHERLAYWDEWNQRDQEILARDPVMGPALRHLQSVEAWLGGQLLESQTCPTPEELFAVSGPMSELQISAERREEISDHVSMCATCAEETRTLASAPPAPLLDLPDSVVAETPSPKWTVEPAQPAATEPAQTAARFEEGSQASGKPIAIPATAIESPLALGQAEDAEPSRQQANPIDPSNEGRILYGLRAFLLSAAALMLIWIFAQRPFGAHAMEPQTVWPEWPTLRSASPMQAIHPAGKVLALSAKGHWEGSIRVPSHDQAQFYRVRIFAHGGSAFDEGHLIATWDHAQPKFEAPTSLAPGHYTMDAFAIVRGTEQALESTDLQVRFAPEILEELSSRSGTERVGFLHEAGWFEDARREALLLPPSAARTSYLAGPVR